MPNPVYLNFTDSDGEIRRHSVHVAEPIVDPASLDDLESAIHGLSHAVITNTLVGQDRSFASSPGAGPYDIQDKLVMEFLDNFGNVTEVTLPAPKPSLFIDSDTLDITQTTPPTYDNALVNDLVSAITAIVKTPGGESLVSLLRGYRTYSRRS